MRDDKTNECAIDELCSQDRSKAGRAERLAVDEYDPDSGDEAPESGGVKSKFYKVNKEASGSYSQSSQSRERSTTS